MIWKLLIVFFVYAMMNAAYAEQIPDYNNPYAPIYTDKEVYTWTDKMKITIVAPSWNENVHGIDSIGGDSNYAVKISSSGHFLKPYRLAETSPSSGVFTGEVTLTGFQHDATGDGRYDTQPRTMGSGPSDGFLETSRDDGITISFEFADGVVLTKSVNVSWNVGDVEFSNENYQENDDVVIKVRDADMNLNPESLDNVDVYVTSDSDSAGVKVSATETDVDSGVFEALVSLTQTKSSSGGRLIAVPGDIITARYEDRTLPSPYVVSDELDVVAKATVGSNTPDTKRFSVTDLYLADSSGQEISELRTDQRFQIVSDIQNNEDYSQQFTCIIQISDSDSNVVSISWVSGQLSAAQNFAVSQSWTPNQSGNYKIETFVWQSLEDARPLAKNYSKSIVIE